MLLTTSDSIAELAAALAKAQGEFPAISKGKTAKVKGKTKDGTPIEYSYAYADLADILDAVRKPLSVNGLAIIQPVVDGADEPTLVTRLLHSSGQWIESTFPMVTYEKPQETGSALTYARRYALTSLLGIAAEEDDDGAAAQGGTRSERSSRGGNRPDCPKCGNSKAVIEGRDEFGGGWLCFKKKDGCGETWHDAARPAKPAPAKHPKGAAPEGYNEPAWVAPGEAPSTTAACAHCGSINVTPDPRAPGWLVCNEPSCRKGTKLAA